MSVVFYHTDASLVSLAALARDTVVMTDLRETVVLYAWPVAGACFIQDKPE